MRRVYDYKVYYNDFELDDVSDFFTYLSYLALLNLLLDKKLISKIIIEDYDEDNNYDPNIIKYVLNISNNYSNDRIKFCH